MKALSLSKIALAIALAVPALAAAESNWVVGPGSANARLDFQITIPRVLYFQVGPGAFATNDTTVQLMSTSVPAATLGGGTVNFAPGTVPVRVVGNNGQVTIIATTLGALQSDLLATDTISFTKIAGSTSDAAIPHPTFVDGGASAAVNVTLSSGKVTNRTADWSFTYANDAIIPPGIYGGVNTRNSRVTYTAAMP